MVLSLIKYDKFAIRVSVGSQAQGGITIQVSRRIIQMIIKQHIHKSVTRLNAARFYAGIQSQMWSQPVREKEPDYCIYDISRQMEILAKIRQTVNNRPCNFLNLNCNDPDAQQQLKAGNEVKPLEEQYQIVGESFRKSRLLAVRQQKYYDLIKDKFQNNQRQLQKLKWKRDSLQAELQSAKRVWREATKASNQLQRRQDELRIQIRNKLNRQSMVEPKQNSIQFKRPMKISAETSFNSFNQPEFNVNNAPSQNSLHIKRQQANVSHIRNAIVADKSCNTKSHFNQALYNQEYNKSGLTFYRKT